MYKSGSNSGKILNNENVLMNWKKKRKLELIFYVIENEGLVALLLKTLKFSFFFTSTQNVIKKRLDSSNWIFLKHFQEYIWPGL